MAKPPKDDYDVGYGHPPKSTQFQPGQSGNPKGRPKGSLNLATALHRAMRERVTVIERGRKKSITKLEAAAKQLANKAASGDLRAFQLLLPQLGQVDDSLAMAPTEVLAEDDKAVMATLLRRLNAAADVSVDIAKKRNSRPSKKFGTGEKS